MSNPRSAVACTTIDANNLFDDLTSLPAEYTYWAGRLAAAQSLVLEAENAMEDARYAAQLELRKQHGKAATVDDIKAMVMLDVGYLEARNKWVASKRECGKLEAVVSGIQYRSRMLQSAVKLRCESEDAAPANHTHPLNDLDNVTHE
jgi:hypothetical protein